MTLNTYSIATAVSLLEQQYARKSSAEYRKADPIDIVAVVAHRGVLTMQSPPLSSITASPRVEIYILDHSVRPSANVKVSLHGLSEVVRTTEEQIIPGDVIRFNGLRLGPQHNSRGATRDSGSDDLIHFEKARDKPEPGYSWYRLGRILIIDETLVPPRAILRDDQRRKENFPLEMATSDQQIQDLITWFPSHLIIDDKNRATITGGGGVPLNSSAIKSARSLLPLPCKRRSLAEIQTSSGVLSNILVFVTHCDAQVLPQSMHPNRRRTHKRPWAPSGTSHPRQILGFATVTDQSGVIMSLFDQGNRFGSKFQEALERKALLSLTNVQSTKQCDIDGRPLASEEIVLWPTRTTAASILPSDESNSQAKTSVLTDLPIANEKISATQPTQNHLAFHSVNEGISGQYITIKSAIFGLSANGRRIDQNIARWTSENLKESLMDSDGLNFAPATIRLTPLDVEGRTQDEFLASGSIVESLFGGISPSEWHHESSTGQSGRGSAEGKKANTAASDGQQICMMGHHAQQLFRALLNEKIQLRWTINLDTETPEVVRVTLPSLALAP